VGFVVLENLKSDDLGGFIFWGGFTFSENI
jgi:hypothetical protein